MLCPILSKNGKIRGILELSDCKNEMFTLDEEYLGIVCASFISNYMELYTRYLFNNKYEIIIF